MGKEKTPAGGGGRPPLPVRLWRGLRSLRFAAILMAIIATACIIGTIVKQEPFDAAKATAQYGRLGLLIGFLGLNELYSTWWFLSLLALFALSTAACALSRLRLQMRRLGSSVVHLSILLVVAGAIVRGLFGVEGSLTVVEGQTAETFRIGKVDTPLGFRLRLDDFRIERYEGKGDFVVAHFKGDKGHTRVPVVVGETTQLRPDTALKVMRYVPHFQMRGKEVFSASDQPVNPAIQIQVSGPAGTSTHWLFSKAPDFHGHKFPGDLAGLRYFRAPGSVKSFESHVTVMDGDDPKGRKAVIMVNRPLQAGRYTLYQQSYDPRTEKSSTLEVACDPGVPLVYAGCSLLVLGMIVVFYVQPLLSGRRSDHV